MDLNTPVAKLPYVGQVYSRRLKKLNIESVYDLLSHAPSRYLDFRNTPDINRLKVGEAATIKGQVSSIKNIYAKSGKKMQIATISDNTGELKVIWFNQPYLVRSIRKGDVLSLAGSLGFLGKVRAFVSPEYEIIKPGKKQIHTGSLVSVYPETAGVSSKWLRSRIVNLIPYIKEFAKEFLPDDIKTQNDLLNLYQAYESIHFPRDEGYATRARKRLAFDELLFLHLRSLHRKNDWRKNKTPYKLIVNSSTVQQLISSLAFELTNSQNIAIEEILTDLKKENPMNRLLEGDVGSGKTVVAATAAFVSFLNGTQTVIMAPTQILAQQHFNTLNNLLSLFKVRISLITSEVIKSDLGRSDIIIGTHALLHKKVNFEKVSLVVIDEQHRFGVEQRTHLIQKTKAPHVLTMTATPIPRTIALTLYGDLDLSTLVEMPKNRIPVKTWIVPPQKRNSGYHWIDTQIKKEEIQVFIVCPLIEVSEVDTMKQVKAAVAEFENLKKIFPKRRIGLLHGRQKNSEKNEILTKFREGKIDILVSTPVVEVGIDIPNATIMVIEGADRFGLAALHQLRGRVGRGDKQSYCLLFSLNSSKKVFERLKAMEKSFSGFELAELDLKLRGPGEIFGVKQHGFPELKIASWQDFELIKKTKDIALEIYENKEKYQTVLNHFFPKEITPN